MKILFMILSVVLALAVLGSATLDIRGDPRVIELMQRLQYRPGFERTLGIIKVLGALGLLIGLFVRGLGLVSAAALAVYFLLAIRAHFRALDPVNEAFPAFGLIIFSIFTLVVGLLS